jgi:poly-gamma-glutamate capsule biosynthesis protein CapA/YwtB (metallophosphatase superfamily)
MNETVTIAIVGDCFPTDRFYVDGAPLSPGFIDTLEKLKAADLRFGNVEPPFSDRGTPADKLAAIRSDPAIVPDIGRLGFDVITLANNHVTDYGPDALADTIAGWDGLGIAHVGAGPSLADAVKPVIVERNGVRIGFLGFSCLVAAGGAASDVRPGVAAIRVHTGYEVDPIWEIEEPGEPLMVTIRTRTNDDDRNFALARVRELREEVDVLCVSIHWGYGGSDELAEYQRPLGHDFVDAGADAVIGNHVHAVQGIEIYNGKPIFYSPGTFIGRQEPFDTSEMSDSMLKVVAQLLPEGYIAHLQVRKDGSSSVEMLPTRVDDHGLPMLAGGELADRIFARMSKHSAKFGTTLDQQEGGIVPVAPW